MRRAPFVVALLALAVMAAVYRGLLPSPMQWLQPAAPDAWLGYVEGETILVAPPIAGRLVARPVERGQRVAAGAPLFRLDAVSAEADVARAEAARVEATAQYANLLTGKRDIELEVIRAQRREAEAALVLAEKELSRARQLAATGATTKSLLDQAASQVDQLAARIAQLRASESAGALGGREPEIAAAEARIREADAALAQSRARLADLAPSAPDAALVEDTFFDPGEWVAAGQPVVSLLAPGRIKLRFFVPQSEIARLAQGTRLRFACDGCPDGLTATISYIAPRAEYTPPVIYSREARRKLVHLVEARPERAGELRIGLPVSVVPLP